MKKLLSLVLALTISAFSFALEVSGVKVAETKTFKENNLVLNGAGTREKMFIDLYVGSLYLGAKTNNAKEIIESESPMLMRLDIISGMVGSKEMKEAVDEGFKASCSPEVLVALKEKIEVFTAAFAIEEIKKGDSFEFYAANDKVTAFKNGKELLVTEGKDFKTGLFGIWLGAKPADKALRTSMLSAK